MKEKTPSPHNAFENTYPHITTWVNGWGWIEIGQDDYSHSMVRALDIGGMVWEGKTEYQTMDDMFQDLEQGLAEWLDRNG